jgi:hypothetical protein
VIRRPSIAGSSGVLIRRWSISATIRCSNKRFDSRGSLPG